MWRIASKKSPTAEVLPRKLSYWVTVHWYYQQPPPRPILVGDITVIIVHEGHVGRETRNCKISWSGSVHLQNMKNHQRHRLRFSHHYNDIIMGAIASQINNLAIVYSWNRLFRRRSKKTLKLRVTGLCVGNSPGTGEFPAQMASNEEKVSIWWRHHTYGIHRLLDSRHNRHRGICATCCEKKHENVNVMSRSCDVTITLRAVMNAGVINNQGRTWVVLYVEAV